MLCQRDPRWKDKVIGVMGGSPVTMGDYGCGWTCLTDFLNDCLDDKYVQYDLTPDVVFDRAQAKGGALEDGSIVWGSALSAFPNTAFLYREYVEKPEFQTQLITPQAAYDKAMKMAKVGCPAFLRVYLGPSPRVNHWVRGKLVDGVLMARDPWTGDEVPFQSRYGDPTHQIFGLAGMFGQVSNAPDSALRTLAWKAYKCAHGTPQEKDTYSREMFDDLTK